MYNEFVLTYKKLRSHLYRGEGDWLVEVAPHYYDLTNFPECEAKRVLERIYERSKINIKGLE